MSKLNEIEVCKKLLQDLSSIKIMKEIPNSKEKLDSMMKDLETMMSKIKNENKKDVVVLKGEIYSKEFLLDLIREITENNKWKLESSELLKQNEIESLKEDLNIDFEDKNVNRYYYSLNIKSKNIVNFVIITVFAGNMTISYQTDNVVYSSKGFVDLKKFKKEIALNLE